MISIRLNLLKWLIMPLLAINLLGAALTYWLAWTPAQTAFDQSLADTAWAIIPRLSVNDGKIQINLPRQEEQILRVDHVNLVFFNVRNAQGQIISGDHDFPALPIPANANEPVTHDGRMRGERIRIIIMKTAIANQPVIISVAETLRKRNRIQSSIILSLLVLETLITVISTTIVWLAISRGLFPLKQMQRDLRERKDDDLSPIHANHIAIELKPVIHAMNNLLLKAEVGATNQQNFWLMWPISCARHWQD